MEYKKITIKEEFIRLDSALKLLAPVKSQIASIKFVLP